MAEMTKNEMLRIVNENISKLENKEYTLYFFVLDTKGNPSSSLEYIYKTAYILSQRGHNVVMLHQEKDFIGVADWLGENYANLKHMNIETENIEITPSDFIFIPEIFANVIMQTKKLPCKRVVIVQNYGNITEFMPVSQTLESLGILDVVATSKKQEEKIKEYFPNVRTHIVSPSVSNVFRNSTEERKLIINLLVKEQSDANKIVKPFYWKNPLYRWVSFRDLRGLPKNLLSEALRESAITIWADDKTDFGLSLLEAVRCGGLVLAKIPESLEDWMIKDGDITNSIMWFNSIDDVNNMIPSVVRSWTLDNIPEEIYRRQEELNNLFTEEIQENEIIEVYEKNIINRRLSDFKETKIDIENNVLKAKDE